MKPDQAAETIEPLWTVADVARFLQVSTSLVYKKVEAGLIPYARLGALLRFDPFSIRAWALGGGQQPGAKIVTLRSTARRHSGVGDET